MYFTELVWHNILEFRHGKRPFGFWNWKSYGYYNVLKEIEEKYYPHYYWTSHIKHIYMRPSGMLDYNIYTISTYGPNKSNWLTSTKPIKCIFKDRKYFGEFKRTLSMKKSI